MKLKMNRQQKCAAQHFGMWLVEHSWFTEAVQSVRDGTMMPGDHEEPRPYQLVNGVAVIPIEGHLTKNRSSFGGTSYVDFRQSLRKAVQDDSANSILLHIDSPGGTVSGAFDAADDVAWASKQKPLDSHIEDLGASGAYLLAAHSRRITANPTGFIGSIGVVAVLVDTSGKMEKDGTVVRVIKTGKYKGGPIEGAPITDEQLADAQEKAEDINNHFLAHVADGRGISIDRARDLADGRVHIADKAMSLGLIDAVRSLDNTLLEISEMNNEQFKEFAAEHPESVAPYIEQGKKAGAAESRTECKAFLAAFIGHEVWAMQQFASGKTLDEAKDFRTSIDAELASVKAEAESKAAEVKAAGDAKSAELAAKQKEIDRLTALVGTQGAVNVGPAAVTNPEQPKTKPDGGDPKALAEWEWDNDESCRAGFSTRERYVAFRSAELTGKIKMISHRAA